MASWDSEIRTIAATDDFITGDRFLAVASTTAGISYSKRDFLFRSGTWRGEQVKAYIRKPTAIRRGVLVTGHSAIPFARRHQWLLQAAGSESIFATNALRPGRRVVPVPIGLTNNCDDSPQHRLFGNTNHIRQVLDAEERPDVFSGSIYANFSIGTFFNERAPLQEQLSTMKNATVETPTMTEPGRLHYLTQIRRHNFTICPRGAGIDTHRLWETLYTGGVPIILRHRSIDPLVRHLPVIQVDDWSQILDTNYLEHAWHLLSGARLQVSSLRMSAWGQRMLDAVRDT